MTEIEIYDTPDVVRKIHKNGKFKQVTLPDNWGKIGKYVKFEIINETELKMMLL